MTIFAADDFNRSDRALLNDTASDGGTWEQWESGDTTDIKIVSNQATTGDSASHYLIHSGVADDDDMTVTALCDPTGDKVRFGLVVHAGLSGTSQKTGYYCWRDTSVNRWQMYRAEGDGTVTRIYNSAPTTVGDAAPGVLEFDGTVGALVMSFAGSAVTSVMPDSTYVAGKSGMVWGGGSGATSGQVPAYYDNFSAETPVVAALELAASVNGVASATASLTAPVRFASAVSAAATIAATLGSQVTAFSNIRPTAVYSKNGVMLNSDGTSTTLNSYCDDEPDGVSADYITNDTSKANGVVSFNLGLMPSDFDYIDSIEIAIDGLALADATPDPLTVRASISHPTLGPFAFVESVLDHADTTRVQRTVAWSTLTSNAQSATRAQWADATLQLEWIYTNDGAATPTQVRVFGVELNGQYVATVSAAAEFAASVTAQTTAAAALTTEIPISAAVTAQATSTGVLSTPIYLQALATADATTAASLTTQLTLQAAATAQASVATSLSTQITMAATVSGSAATAVELGTQIGLVATLSGNGAAVGSLTTQITAAAALSVEAAASANLTAGIGVAASASVQATTSAVLTTQIAAAADVSVQATAAAALTTGLVLQSAASAQATMSAGLTTQITLAADAAVQATVSGVLDNVAAVAQLQASLQAQGGASAGLTTQIAAATSLSAGVSVAGALSSAAQSFGAAIQVQATASAGLTTQIHFGASAQTQVQCFADLATEIRFTGNAALSASVQGLLGSAGQQFQASVGITALSVGALTTAVTLHGTLTVSVSAAGDLFLRTAPNCYEFTTVQIGDNELTAVMIGDDERTAVQVSADERTLVVMPGGERSEVGISGTVCE